MSKNGISQYEEKIKNICNIKNIETKSNGKDIQNAIYGIAMVLSVMEGVNTNINVLSKHLQCEVFKLENSYTRLRDNGVFSEKYDLNNDKMLKKQYENNFLSKEHAYNVGWAMMAGIAAGYYGMRNKKDKKLIG